MFVMCLYEKIERKKERKKNTRSFSNVTWMQILVLDTMEIGEAFIIGETLKPTP